MTLGAAFARGSNLDLLRLCAALLVLFSHSFVLAGQPEAEPVARLMGHSIDGGGMAVAAFFVLSGFLIARSAERHSLPRYVGARAARIYPAYLLAIVVQTFGVGLLMTRLPAGTYLTQAATWMAVLRAAPFSPAMGLPGVFEGNPAPLQVNGSLWTLRLEVLCYLGLGVAAWAGMLRPRWILAGAACGFVLLGAVTGLGPRVEPVVACGLHFCMGAAFWCWRDFVRIRVWGVAACAAVVGLSLGTRYAAFAWQLAFPYIVLAAALTPPVAAGLMRRLGDVSYGTYLFAFPVQQCLVAWFAPGPLALTAMAVPPVLGLAVLSRRFVEQPALAWARPSPPGPGLVGAARNNQDQSA